MFLLDIYVKVCYIIIVYVVNVMNKLFPKGGLIHGKSLLRNWT